MADACSYETRGGHRNAAQDRAIGRRVWEYARQREDALQHDRRKREKGQGRVHFYRNASRVRDKHPKRQVFSVGLGLVANAEIYARDQSSLEERTLKCFFCGDYLCRYIHVTLRSLSRMQQ